jgi:hypothetical protein
MKPFAIAAILFCVVIFAAFGQQQAAPQKAPSPGITPAAPPTITGVDSLVSTCTFTDQNRVEKPGIWILFQTQSVAMAPATFGLACVSSVQQGQIRPPVTNVWTAQESQAQFNFLRAEVKSTIENAVTDKIVNSATIQDAVTQTLQDDQRLKAAVTAALNQEMDGIESKIVTDVLAKIKAQQTNPQTAQAKKPQ